MLSANFYGVRGSTPCSCDTTRGFGGNTSCVLVEVPDEPPIICDLGTGVRYLGRDICERGLGPGFTATALISHLHWDHIQGVPFFLPVLQEGSRLDIVGPAQSGSSIEAEFAKLVRPPAFPVAIEDLPGHIAYRDATGTTLEIGSAQVRCFAVEHVGPTNGYRIDVGDGSLAYISDHQQPLDGSLDVPDQVVEACADVDILIHDAQFDADEFRARADWGHCTPDFALELARRSGAKRLVLFHHDPAHDDAWIRSTVDRIQRDAGSAVEVIGAAEGLCLTSGSD